MYYELIFKQSRFLPTPNEVIEQMMFNQEVAKERGWSLPKKQTKNK